VCRVYRGRRGFSQKFRLAWRAALALLFPLSYISCCVSFFLPFSREKAEKDPYPPTSHLPPHPMPYNKNTFASPFPFFLDKNRQHLLFFSSPGSSFHLPFFFHLRSPGGILSVDREGSLFSEGTPPFFPNKRRRFSLFRPSSRVLSPPSKESMSEVAKLRPFPQGPRNRIHWRISLSNLPLRTSSVRLTFTSLLKRILSLAKILPPFFSPYYFFFFLRIYSEFGDFSTSVFF